MKTITLLLSIIISFMQASGQGIEALGIPKVETKNGTLFWSGISINDIVNKSDLIFEGRALSDSALFMNPPGHINTVYEVLVLKKFKGNFSSDTVRVITMGGRMIINGQSEGTPGVYIAKGAEAVFFATSSTHVPYGGSDPNTYWPFYGTGVSYVTVCDKNDVVKEVYQPVETAVGHPYEDVRPNNCATQKKK